MAPVWPARSCQRPRGARQVPGAFPRCTVGLLTQRLDVGTRAKIYQPDGGVLGAAGDEDVAGDGGDGVRVGLGAQGKGTRDTSRLGRPDLQGLIVGRRQEGGGVEGIEGQVGDAKLVRAPSPVAAKDAGHGRVRVRRVRVAAGLEVPYLQRGV